MTKPILLFTGAMGNQGGATLDELLRRRVRCDMRTVARNPEALKATALAAREVTPVRDDLNNTGSLRAAAREDFRCDLPALRPAHPGLLTPSWTAMPSAA